MFCGMAILGISTVSKTQKHNKVEPRNAFEFTIFIVLQLLLRGNNLGSSAASRGNWLKESLVALSCFIH